MPMIGRRPEMRAYKPTVQDNVARFATNLFGDTYAGRNFVRNVFGSSGLGETGRASVADFTPAGLAFEADKAGRLAGQGHPWAAAGNLALAALPIPAVAKGAKGMIGKGLKAVEKKAAPFIEAYHGSPHTFDKFSLDKIGTGEGAQAYGHGLYFAENEGVAKSYRDKLSNWTADGKGLSKKLSMDLGAYGGDLDALMAHRTDQFAKWNAQDPKHFITQDLRKDIKELEALKAKSLGSGGSMYQVRINADPNDFLDWDAPLSGQSEKVRAAGSRRALPDDLPRVQRQIADGSISGAGLYRAPLQIGGRSDAPATRAWAEAGIPGIKYLDQGSRSAGEGSRNFVVFDPKIIDIMKRYGVAAPVAAAILAGTVPRPAEAKDQPNLFRQPGQ